MRVRTRKIKNGHGVAEKGFSRSEEDCEGWEEWWNCQSADVLVGQVPSEGMAEIATDSQIITIWCVRKYHSGSDFSLSQAGNPSLVVLNPGDPMKKLIDILESKNGCQALVVYSSASHGNQVKLFEVSIKIKQEDTQIAQIPS